MKIGKPGFWIALCSLALVVWFVWKDSSQVSPGELSAAHAQDPDLKESSCEACHGDDAKNAAGMAAACAHCHAPIAEQIAARRGLHGTLAGDVQRCGTCHSEHHGRGFRMVTEAAFKKAGVDDPAHFDHKGLGFALGGKHLALECKKCHVHADDALLAKGQKRFGGESQACASCHKDPHEGQLPDCKSCHGEEKPFAEAPLYKHTERFELAGSHAGVACAKCHAKGSPTSIESDGAAQRAGRLAVRACQSCHESPHAASFLAAAATALALPAEAACVQCHPLTVHGFRGTDARLAPEQHAFSGFALAAPHDKQECKQCHAPEQPFAAAHPGRKLESCTACHKDPHAGQFGARGCRECHEDARWKPSRIDLAAHARAGFALEDAHAKVACDACHLERAQVRRYADTPKACSGCHADAHPGAFAQAQGCGECHKADSFVAAAKGFDHARWTGFVVDGAHAKAACESCHVPLAAPDAARRRFGRVAAHAPARAGDCANCHADAHRGFFAKSKGCQECHTTADFTHTRERFDHGKLTGFALVGAHERRECTICHVAAAAPDPATRRAFGFSTVPSAKAQLACTSCHADPHGDSFAKARGCLDCHTQESWKAARASFDHLHWTGFALEGVHRETGCEACHTPLAPGDASGRRFARASGKLCADCHADPHLGQFAVAGANDCTRCHTSQSDFKQLSFDHQRDSRFPLDETHKKVACAACHQTWPLAGGGKAVRYKPLGILCGDCHDPRH